MLFHSSDELGFFGHTFYIIYINLPYRPKYLLALELLMWSKFAISGGVCGDLPRINTSHTSEVCCAWRKQPRSSEWENRCHVLLKKDGRITIGWVAQIWHFMCLIKLYIPVWRTKLAPEILFSQEFSSPFPEVHFLSASVFDHCPD